MTKLSLLKVPIGPSSAIVENNTLHLKHGHNTSTHGQYLLGIQRHKGNGSKIIFIPGFSNMGIPLESGQQPPDVFF